jgi:hypothetical protein
MVEKELAVFGDTASGKFHMVSMAYEHIQFVTVYFSPVLKLQNFRLFTTDAWEVCPEGFWASFHYGP